MNKIILTILVAFLAIVCTLYKDILVLSGYYRGPAQKYNGGKCRYLEGLKLKLCEDIKIHHASGLAYLACGDKQSSKTYSWPPPIDTYKNIPLRGTFYVYNIKTDKLTPLILKNFADEEDFILHGFGIYESPIEPDNLYFFIINHKRTGSVIELFEHKINTFELNHLKTFKHDLIYSPNNVVPVSKDEFYITNDFYSQSYWKIQFEMLARLRWSNVVFHSSKANTTEIVVDGLIVANGINVNWDYSRIFIGTSGTGELLIYERKPDSKLKMLDTINVEHLVDNVNVDPVTGEIYLAVAHNGPELFLYASGLTCLSKKPSFGVIKISNNTKEDKFYGIKYAKEKIFEDDGTFFHSLSVAAGDSRRKVMFWGSPFAEGVVRCELD
ncbi:13061_t:CDS:2 [Dentiscutata heterogama]|uniref:13061_t:CDS:1 n=1 Tax=Dentiscutata heterogama TaxID=1316150 RepID=A0ACA9K2L8_9GLOM|nr:13061_t:CDS:2 [Dentiscutata heterogama]